MKTISRDVSITICKCGNEIAYFGEVPYEHTCFKCGKTLKLKRQRREKQEEIATEDS